MKSQLASAYPQADLTMQRIEEGDPAYLRPDEKVMTALLDLRTGEHLPIRTFRDADVEDERNSQADHTRLIRIGGGSGLRAHSALLGPLPPAGPGAIVVSQTSRGCERRYSGDRGDRDVLCTSRPRCAGWVLPGRAFCTSPA
ncbi:MAG: hypothetical protein WKH64_07625 [Chloroflexia bacterium]